MDTRIVRILNTYGDRTAQALLDAGWRPTADDLKLLKDAGKAPKKAKAKPKQAELVESGG